MRPDWLPEGLYIVPLRRPSATEIAWQRLVDSVDRTNLALAKQKESFASMMAHWHRFIRTTRTIVAVHPSRRDLIEKLAEEYPWVEVRESDSVPPETIYLINGDYLPEGI